MRYRRVTRVYDKMYRFPRHIFPRVPAEGIRMIASHKTVEALVIETHARSDRCERLGRTTKCIDCLGIFFIGTTLVAAQPSERFSVGSIGWGSNASSLVDEVTVPFSQMIF